jgi:hypothetical protein
MIGVGSQLSIKSSTNCVKKKLVHKSSVVVQSLGR